MPEWPFRVALLGAGSPLAGTVQASLRQAGFAVEAFDAGSLPQASLLAGPTAWLLLPASQSFAESLAAALPRLAPAEPPVGVLALSSYRVFSGEKSGFYNEADTPDATDAVAMPWLALERWAGGFPAHCVLRTDRLFGPDGENVLTRLLEGVLDTGAVHVTSHLRGCPTAESDITRVLAAMLKQLGSGAACQGAYHYCSGDITQCNEFAEAVITHARQFQAVPEVKIIPHDAEASGQRSPLLSCQRILDHFGIRQRAWHSSLPGVIREYFTLKGKPRPASRPQ